MATNYRDLGGTWSTRLGGGGGDSASGDEERGKIPPPPPRRSAEVEEGKER